MGWPGATVKDEEKVRKEMLKKYRTHSVFIPEDQMEKFYEGFCNKTLWPLFHYFPVYTQYETAHWENYIDVNRIFCDELLRMYKSGDVIWIHDYHLMLLPAMIREKIPDATIGFFLHIPFPSFEIFRLLPSECRMSILKGLYGADLVGFHTHDYRTYFLSSTLRILGLSNNMGEVGYFTRTVKVDSFPMGIDYEKFHSAVNTEGVKAEVKGLKANFGNKTIILSIDRQDYSKGILNRLKGYELFLKKNPKLINEVMLVMVIIPSRVGVESYMTIKNNIDELVGKINGEYGTLSGAPILYQYRSLNFEELIALYYLSDVALVTPLRDGMNLIAKEYITCKTEGRGVLILSEMAGAVDELAESIIINPNNIEEIAEAISKALSLPVDEQREKLAFMQQRLKDYDVFKWAESFLKSLNDEKDKQRRLEAKVLPESVRKNIIAHFKRAPKRLLFLDYDGTLQAYAKMPALAVPEKKLIAILERLLYLNNLEMILISGRDWQTMDKWFGHMPLNLVAEHGLFIKEKNKSWRIIKPVRRNWKKKVLAEMLNFSEKLPGAFVEEKDYSLAFHFRRSDPDLASLRVRELMSHLVNLTTNLDVKLMRGNKVIEVRSSGIDKGIAAMHWLSKVKDPSRFIMAIGDDVTDEDLFRVIPKDGYSIRVGRGTSYAMYNLDSAAEVVQLLEELAG